MVTDINSFMANMTQVSAQMADFLESLATPEKLSGALRKSLRPARRGVTAVQDAVSLIQGWRDLAGDAGNLPLLEPRPSPSRS